MNVKFQGNPVTLEGNIVKVGDVAPDFVVIDNGLTFCSSKMVWKCRN